MAEMAAERRSGFPWWGWLFIFIAIALIIWGIVAWSTGSGSASRVRYSPGVGLTPASNQPIRDLEALYSPADVNAVIGRTVDITGARVMSVVGNGLFWIGEPGAQQVLVDDAALKQNPGGASQSNAQPKRDVAVGDIVTVTGHVAPMLTWPRAQSRWNANGSLRPAIEGHRIYILATGVTVTPRR